MTELVAWAIQHNVSNANLRGDVEAAPDPESEDAPPSMYVGVRRFMQDEDIDNSTLRQLIIMERDLQVPPPPLNPTQYQDRNMFDYTREEFEAPQGDPNRVRTQDLNSLDFNLRQLNDDNSDRDGDWEERGGNPRVRNRMNFPWIFNSYGMISFRDGTTIPRHFWDSSFLEGPNPGSVIHEMRQNGTMPEHGTDAYAQLMRRIRRDQFRRLAAQRPEFVTTTNLNDNASFQWARENNMNIIINNADLHEQLLQSNEPDEDLG